MTNTSHSVKGRLLELAKLSTRTGPPRTSICTASARQRSPEMERLAEVLRANEDGAPFQFNIAPRRTVVVKV